MNQAPTLVEHFFRHEYGRLVSTLCRRTGAQHLEIIEDAVQSALMTALEHWQANGLPNTPSAWLFSVAHNNVITELRKQTGRRRILEKQADERPLLSEMPEATLAGELPNDLLSMLFTCCNENIPIESQLALALKTLCGFDVQEIAQRLFTSKENIYKRLTRARLRLREVAGDQQGTLQELSPHELSQRRPAVLKVLYLLFTEGYLSSHAEEPIRKELCQEAIRLALVLAGHSVGQEPETYALLALMHLHFARLPARQDSSGGLLLLEEQDRSLWAQEHIQSGLHWLGQCASGDRYSRYHAEAGIAAEHCLAPSFETTRWDKIAAAYELLERVAPSALHRLNRSLAVAEHLGPRAGLAVLEAFVPPSWLAGSYLWYAVLADLHLRSGQRKAAKQYRASALQLAPTPAVQALLQRRLS